MKVTDVLAEEQLDEMLPAIGFGAAVGYLLNALAVGMTIYDLIGYAEKEGTWDATKWSDETKQALFEEAVLTLGLLAAIKAFGAGYKLYKSKFPKGFWKHDDNVKSLSIDGA